MLKCMLYSVLNIFYLLLILGYLIWYSVIKTIVHIYSYWLCKINRFNLLKAELQLYFNQQKKII